ncbi:hypothetical protein BDD12DRAFT_130451 [Trichophaea hybrida]|nr:hypothetical protein BDD12DRAFT_130451 [Trichophaea hybrida]
MSVQPQANIVSPVLPMAAYVHLTSVSTTDGVSIQVLNFLDAFGQRFAINPQRTSHIREVCQNVGNYNVLLHELKLAVGWMRNDSTFVLGQSTGGQSAIAFIVAATEMFTPSELISIMLDMATNEVPAALDIPSGRDIERLLSNLFNRYHGFGFSQHWAETITAIRRIRVSLFDNAALDELTVAPSRDAAVHLLQAILSCQRDADDNDVLYIEGDVGMGWIAAAVSWWLFSLVRITCEGKILVDCVTPRCIVQVTKSTTTRYWIERQLCNLERLLPRAIAMDHEAAWPEWGLTYRIEGLVEAALGSLGLPCRVCKDACYSVAAIILGLTESLSITWDGSKPPKPFQEYLGENSTLDIRRALHRACGVTPECLEDSVHMIEQVDRLITGNLPGICCTCGGCLNSFGPTWFSRYNKTCRIRQARVLIVELAWKILASMLVDTDHNYIVMLGGASSKISYLYPVAVKALTGVDQTIKISDLLRCVCCGLGVEWEEEPAIQIGSAKFGCCVYIPAVIWPTSTQSKLSRIKVVQGAFIYRNTYFESLLVNEGNDESRQWYPGRADLALQTKRGVAVAGVSYTARDMVDDLLISIRLRDNVGNERFANPLRAAWNAAWAIEVPDGNCSVGSHRYGNTADVSVVYFQGNEISCFYNCDLTVRVVFLRNGCLGCAVSVADDVHGVIIQILQN